MSLPAEIVMAVIRGDRALAALEEAGVSFAIVRRRYGARRVKATAGSSFTVAPNPIDIATGLLANKKDPKTLSDWATFILASDVIDLTRLDSLPEGDALLNALWDASFERHVRETELAVAASLT